MNHLNGKRFAIIGATGMIGSTVARMLASRGASVWLGARRAEPLEALRAELSAGPAAPTCLPVDATDRSDVEAFFTRLARDFGACHGVFNAIGLDAQHAGALCEPSVGVTRKHFGEYTETVVWSQFLTASVAAGQLIANGGGSIVFLTATPARGIAPWMAGHSAGHAAVEGLTRALALEWGPGGVRVNAVRSGGMPETPRIKAVLTSMSRIAGIPPEAMIQGAAVKPVLRRMPTLAQTAETVAFLLSDASASLSGAILNASCGEVLD